MGPRAGADGVVEEYPLVAAVRRTVDRFGLLTAGEGLVVGVSGGQDSVALLDVLCALAGELGLRLHVAHLNHGLRGAQADEDEQFVRQLAVDLGLPCTTRRREVGGLAREWGLSVEVAGRQARYQLFEQARQEQELDKIAVGHTATDRAETLLINLLRGTGLDGLASIPAQRGRVVRPLILATRQDTADHCRSRGLRYRRDPSNVDVDHLRARLREELLPLLEREYQPRAGEALARAAELVADDAELLRELARARYEQVAQRSGDEVRLGIGGLLSSPAALRRRIVRQAVRDLTGELTDLGLGHCEAALELARAGQTGKRAELPGSVVAEVSYDALVLRAAEVEAEPGAVEEWLRVPGRLTSEALGIVLEAEVLCREGLSAPLDEWGRADLDYDRAGSELVVRNWRPGDRFQPLGMSGEKKLQDFFVDAKVPRRGRARVPLVAQPNGRILWVVGHRIDERAKIGENTTSVLRLSVEPVAERSGSTGVTGD
ncbi:MAG: tRNA lysidine(34) synthetase TilS [Armatimonadota bacterium]